MSQTLGQKRVKAEFNPDKNELVDQIKNKSAELIDLLESMKEVGSYVQKIPSEKNRLIALSQTAYEQGAMWAVKANFT